MLLGAAGIGRGVPTAAAWIAASGLLLLLLLVVMVAVVPQPCQAFVPAVAPHSSSRQRRLTPQSMMAWPSSIRGRAAVAGDGGDGGQQPEQAADEAAAADEEEEEEDIIMRFFQQIEAVEEETKAKAEKAKQPKGPRPYFQDLAVYVNEQMRNQCCHAFRPNRATVH